MLLLPVLLSAVCGPLFQDPEEPAPPFVVFVTGDEEYRSEESMPMLAGILEAEFGFRVAVCYALDVRGRVDPNRLDHIAGLEALDDADLMVLFTRFRQLPEREARRIAAFADSGKPLVGFRTATHAFRYEAGHDFAPFNDEWPRRVFGQKWITHHGHFGDGEKRLTAVEAVSWRAGHPILRGVEPFEAYSWLYHVDGGGDTLSGDSRALLVGRALESGHAKADRLARFPRTNPVAWTKSHAVGGKENRASARVFFTTLGHPYDFRERSARRLAIQGILWALGLEARIPAEGVRADFAFPYEPNPSGFGQKYKQDLVPRYLPDSASAQ